MRFSSVLLKVPNFSEDLITVMNEEVIFLKVMADTESGKSPRQQQLSFLIFSYLLNSFEGRRPLLSILHSKLACCIGSVMVWLQVTVEKSHTKAHTQIINTVSFCIR